MHTEEIENYFGKLGVEEVDECFGDVLLLVHFEDGVPRRADVYSLCHEEFRRGLRVWESSSGSPLKVDAGNMEILLDFGKATTTYHFNSPSVASVGGPLQECSICEVTGLPEKDAGSFVPFSTIACFSISRVRFLDDTLEAFKWKAIKNLHELESISQKYSFEFKQVGPECKYLPWVVSSRGDGDAFSLVARNLVRFEFDKIVPVCEALGELEPKMDLLLGAIGLLDGRRHHYDKVTIESRSAKEYCSLTRWRQTTNDSREGARYSVDRGTYLGAVDLMYAGASGLDKVRRRKLIVAMERLQKGLEQNDISIKVALYHVVLTHLLAILDRRKHGLKSAELRKVFTAHGIQPARGDIQELDKFNNLRNLLFKSLMDEFDYHSIRIESINLAVDYIGKLFAKILHLDNASEAVLLDAISRNHHIPVK